METKRPTANEVLWACTDARCVNAKQGRLLGRYLGKDLSPEQQQAFEQHMDECLACEITVLNWENLRKALSEDRANQGSTPE
jgi:anti-sigma factor RsiW